MTDAAVSSATIYDQKSFGWFLGAVVGICAAAELGGWWTSALHAPLVLGVVLSLRRSRRLYAALAVTAVTSLLLPWLWREPSVPDQWGDLLAAACVALPGGLPGPTESPSGSPEIPRPMRKPAAARRAASRTKTRPPSVAAADACGSADLASKNLAPTKTLLGGQDASKSVQRKIVCRLRATEKFTSKQLVLIERALQELLATDSDLGWSLGNLPVGTEIGGYRILGVLSRGGSSQVYRVQPVAGGEPLALKVLHSMRSTARFRREMELVQRLAHPNIVVAYDVGEFAGLLYIAMEQLSGPDLNVYVEQQGPMTWQQSLDVMVQAARGLQHAHQRGLIHRDVKPGNLLWDEGDHIKVTDLGLATLVSEQLSNGAAEFDTGAEMVAGTVDFMAPEQARSLAGSTPLSDIYSLGATWYYLLTGRSHLRGSTLSKKLNCLLRGRGVRQLPPECAPEPVRQVWSRMAAYRPEDRYSSMCEVRAALEAVRPANYLATAEQVIHVLVIEDDHDDLYVTVEMLKRINHCVRAEVAGTLGQAIQLGRALQELDLILLDLELPGCDGVEAVQRVRSAASDVPIIALTRQDEPAVREACVAAGADYFAYKNALDAHDLERMIFITLSRCK